MNEELKMPAVLDSRTGHVKPSISGLAKHSAALEPASVMLAGTWIKMSAKPRAIRSEERDGPF
jgi:hypothetical protein